MLRLARRIRQRFQNRGIDPRACSPTHIVRLGSPIGRSATREFHGTLIRVPKVGEPLLLSVGEDRRLITSAVRRIDTANDRMMYVETRNSRYFVSMMPIWRP